MAFTDVPSLVLHEVIKRLNCPALLAFRSTCRRCRTAVDTSAVRISIPFSDLKTAEDLLNLHAKYPTAKQLLVLPTERVARQTKPLQLDSPNADTVANGAQEIPSARPSAAWMSLKSLDLSQVSFSLLFLHHLLPSLPCLNHLALPSTPTLSEQPKALNLLSKLTCLHSLSLSHWHLTAGKTQAALSLHTQLTALELLLPPARISSSPASSSSSEPTTSSHSSSGINGHSSSSSSPWQGLQPLTQLQRLKVWRVPGQQLEQLLKIVASLPQLQQLALPGIWLTSPKELAAVRHLSKLERLDSLELW